MSDGSPRLVVGLTAEESVAVHRAQLLGTALAALTKPLGLGRMFTPDGPTDLARRVLGARRGYQAETQLLVEAALALWEDDVSTPNLVALRQGLRPEDAQRLWSLMYAIAAGRVTAWIVDHQKDKGHA